MTEAAPKTHVFKGLYWNFEEDDETNSIQIHIGGRTEDGKSVHCIVLGYTPCVFLELPKRISWNNAKCIAVYNYLRNVMRNDGPLSFFPVRKYKLHFKEKINTLCLTFPTQKACSFFMRKMHDARNGIFIENVGSFSGGEFVVHEQNIDPLLKFTATNRIQLAGWISATEKILEEDEGLDEYDRKFSTADIDFYADWTSIQPYEFPEKRIVTTKPKYNSFDIECYSKNPNSKLPDPNIPENKIFQIASVYSHFGGDSKNIIRYLFSLGNPHDLGSEENGDKVTIIRCKTEKELLLKWVEVCRQEDPDIFLGYNIMKFDWDYMISRAEYLGIYSHFSKLSRIIGKSAELKKVRWESAAYGEQEFRYLDAKGRTNFDVILEVERNYKLPKYSLDSVAEFFLGEHKDDISPRQLFMLVQLTDEITPMLEAVKSNTMRKELRVEIKTHIQRILIARYCTGEVLKLRRNLLVASTKDEMYSLIREAYTLTGKYNVQDCILPIRLAEKLNLLVTMEETANITSVPVSYLHTRGQGIKVLSQVFRETIFNDYVIPFKQRVLKENYVKYQGAIVAEAHPGDYKKVACFDFASLYPSSMIAYNICYTTFIKNDDPISDDLCHVLEISNHVGCEHDPQHRKKKAADIMCSENRYRFRKMIIHPDGTREHEGLLPKMEKNLLANRKMIKREMEKLEALYDTATGKATEDKIAEYKSWGWNVAEKGSLSKEQLDIIKVAIQVLNARQLAVKVAANSGYGVLGAQGGHIPLVEGAASVTYIGRMLITAANKYISEKNPGDPNNNFKGKAMIVYGDTDSTMLYFKDLTTEETFDLSERLSNDTSHFLKTLIMKIDEHFSIECPEDGNTYRIDKYPRKKMNGLSDELKVAIYTYDSLPINLQFENLYGRYLLLSKKRYVAYIYNRKSQVTKVTKKGVVLARRDNSQYLRDTYKSMVDAILDEKGKDEVMHRLYDRVHKLFTRQIPDAHLIIYMGVQSIMNYAKHKDVIRGRGDTVTVYTDAEGKAFEPFGQLDPRLQYSNIPQVLLTLKMLRRGDDVPANTRLEFLYLEDTEDICNHQGEKAEDYAFYRENRKTMKPDFLHYVEKQLSKPITELLAVKYLGDVIPYEKLEDAFARRVQELNDLQRLRVLGCKEYVKSTALCNNLLDDCSIGWQAVCDKCISSKSGICFNHSQNSVKPREYKFKKLIAQATYIIESTKRHAQKKPNEIDGEKHSELVNLCLQIKSKDILDTIYTKHSLRKRQMKKPPQASEKLRLKTNARGETQVVFICDTDVSINPESSKQTIFVKRNTIATLKNIHEVELNTSLKKNKKYTYDMLIHPVSKGVKKDDVMVYNVDRNLFNTFTYRDSNMMKNILLARGSYKTVIMQLDELFSPFKFPESKVKQFEIVEEEDEN